MAKKRYKIGIWGQFGDGGKIADGQAVRTTIITNELKARYGENEILVVNTNNWKKHPFSFFFNTVRLNAKADKVVIFPADNGFKIGVPIFDFFNRFYKRELYDVVIGGYLPALLKSKPVYLKMLAKYKALFVQTPNIRKDLEELGVGNIQILSNLKRLTRVQRESVEVNTAEAVRVCVMSRITADKGISYAVDAVRLANEALGGLRIRLDIYGMIAKDYEDDFHTLLKENAEFVSYGGIVDFDKTTDTLKDYFLMLFPTFYHGEGFPGCVVDAYCSALPIIATDWNYNGDVIRDGENGVLVPIKDAAAMKDAILMLYNDRERVRRMALTCLEDSEEYTPDKVLRDFYRYMDN